MISTVVVLPAPFGPSRANTSPRRTERSIPRTACTSTYDFVSPLTSMARASTNAVYARLQGPAPAVPGFRTVPEAHLSLPQPPAQEDPFTVSLRGEVDEPGLGVSQKDPR